MTARPLPPRTTDQNLQPRVALDQAAAREAIVRAVPALVAQADAIDPATLLLASNVGATYDLPTMADLRDKAIAKFAGDPEAAAPMFRRMAYPDSPVTAEDVARLRTFSAFDRHQWLMATAFTCDGDAFPKDWSQQARKIMAQPDETSGYVVTHAGLALFILLERGCTLADSSQLRDDIVAKLRETVLATPFSPTDLKVETAVVLGLLGRSDLISPEWVTMTLDAQLPDGSWDATAATQNRSPSWHTTLLAIWFLAAVQNPQARGPFFS